MGVGLQHQQLQLQLIQLLILIKPIICQESVINYTNGGQNSCYDRSDAMLLGYAIVSNLKYHVIYDTKSNVNGFKFWRYIKNSSYVLAPRYINFFYNLSEAYIYGKTSYYNASTYVRNQYLQALSIYNSTYKYLGLNPNTGGYLPDAFYAISSYDGAIGLLTTAFTLPSGTLYEINLQTNATTQYTNYTPVINNGGSGNNAQNDFNLVYNSNGTYWKAGVDWGKLKLVLFGNKIAMMCSPANNWCYTFYSNASYYSETYNGTNISYYNFLYFIF